MAGDAELMILERGRLALVGVDSQVVGQDVGRKEAPLLAGAEAGPTAPAQAGRLHLFDKLVRLSQQRRPQPFVATGRQIPGQRVGVVKAHATEQDVGGAEVGHQSPADCQLVPGAPLRIMTPCCGTSAASRPAIASATSWSKAFGVTDS